MHAALFGSTSTYSPWQLLFVDCMQKYAREISKLIKQLKLIKAYLAISITYILIDQNQDDEQSRKCEGDES